MNRNGFYKVLLGAMMLAPMVTACSGDDDEDNVQEWMLLDDNNSTVYVEFDANLKDLAGVNSTLDKFKVYGFNTALGYSVFGNTKSKTAQGVDVTRNKDDESMWDYEDSKTNAMLKWAALIKYPVSFYGIAGEGAGLATIGTKNKLPTLRVEMPADNDGIVKSEDTNDLLFAKALRLDPNSYLNDSTKIELDFEHVMPMMQVRAALVNANDLEVTVQSAKIMGLVSASEYDFNEVKPAWTAYTPNDKTATVDVALALDNEVKVTESPAYLQNRGVFVVPQTVKPWTSAANKDGAGIKIMARVRSKASNTYLVGSESGFGEVYMPLDNSELASGNIYTIDITFNTIFNADGSLGYRASYTPVVTPWVEKNVNLILK